MTNMHMLFMLALILIWALLQWQDKMPKMHSVHTLVETVNSRGGNILVLLSLSIYFFYRAMRLFTLMMDLSKGGVIGQDNAYALMALQFVTASAFGGAFSAMLKTMTGGDSKARAADVVPTVNASGVSGQ